MRRKDDITHSGVEYVGLPGITAPCIDAVMRLVQYNEEMDRAHILTNDRDHCLLLSVNGGDLVAVRSGFASGYGGEGPRGFSFVLAILHYQGVDIDEYEVSREFMEKLDNSSLSEGDIEWLATTRPVRPMRWPEYVLEKHVAQEMEGTLWRDIRPVIPLTIVDSRLTDLVKSFWNGPDDRLMTGYRRLEDVVRGRTGLTESGHRLFSHAFLGDQSKLIWRGIDGGEKAGRGLLFTGAYQAHRNPRAHRESRDEDEQHLSEFLLLNHLFRLEREAVDADSPE